MTTHDRELLAEQFEENRAHLRAVAYRMLGSMTEAEDAVQEAWLRLERTDDQAIENLRAWLTTVVGRVCLDMLRSRRSRKEYSPEDWRPEPIVISGEGADPEHEAEIADSVGLALLVVLETLTPAERLAFVLHDVFGVEFDEIAPIVGRTPVAARQLASRARRRVRVDARVPEGDLAQQRRVVDAFLAASRAGSFEALVEVLDPDVEFRIDRDDSGRRAPVMLTGSTAVAERILRRGPRLARLARPAIVNGAAGAVIATDTQVIAVIGFTVAGGRIVALDLITDPARIGTLNL
jgi:RNA polymerase sigma-70 factor (ECF subfamily)